MFRFIFIGIMVMLVLVTDRAAKGEGPILPEDILTFWFSDRVKPLWYEKSASFDQEIREKFGHLYEKAASGELDHWQEDSRSLLALIIILDQFPRNMFRGQAKMYQTDAKALKLAKLAFERKVDRKLSHKDHLVFLYMPFMHSENIIDQKLALSFYKTRIKSPENVNPAQRHHDIVEKFGRFPHRNEILGRPSTPEEIAFLKQPNSSF